ncbi:hypothetical protein K438DRAFT_2136385 [Mycena galopus ATCC 62051]|nr:hypothetical protein K438DRAFT_2136385 [Mycena galopus ATCC 62051]
MHVVAAAPSSRLATSTRGSSDQRQACHIDAGLETSMPGSPIRRAPRHLVNARLTSSTPGSPFRRGPRHLDTRIPTSTRTLSMYLRLDGARHVDLRLPKSACPSPPRRGARRLDAGLVASTRGSTQRGARDLNAGLTISTPFRCGPRVLDLRRATSKPRRHGTRDLDPHLVTSTRGSEPRHLDARLATLTRSLLLHVHNVLLG